MFLKIYTKGENQLNSLEQNLWDSITERHSGKHSEYWIRTVETHVDGTWPAIVADLLILLFNTHLLCLRPMATVSWRETASMWTSLAFHPWRVASSYSAVTLLFLHVLTLPSSWMTLFSLQTSKTSPLSLTLLMARASQENRSIRKGPPQTLPSTALGHTGAFSPNCANAHNLLCTWSHHIS